MQWGWGRTSNTCHDVTAQQQYLKKVVLFLTASCSRVGSESDSSRCSPFKIFLHLTRQFDFKNKPRYNLKYDFFFSPPYDDGIFVNTLLRCCVVVVVFKLVSVFSGFGSMILRSITFEKSSMEKQDQFIDGTKFSQRDAFRESWSQTFLS